MVTFILAAILIILATLALLVWPLLFTRNTFSFARHAQNIHYAKERLAELEDQLKNASISATDYEALKLEIETTLAQDIDLANAEQNEETPLPRRPNKAAIGSICVLLPLGAAAFYAYVGTPEALNSVQTVTTNTAAPSGNAPPPQEINQMVSNLEQRLADNPNDAQGWALLSRTYLALGQFGKARNGFMRVIELGEESADVYAALADASALAANGMMQGDPTRYADKALSMDPNNRQALWLSGLSAVQSGNHPKAKKSWGLLLTLLADQPDQQAELREIMSEALGTSSVAQAPQTTAEPEDKTSSQPAQANTSAENVVENGVQVSVSIDEAIRPNVNPFDSVFIFARAVNGPPPPVAVKRLRVSDLPVTITLSDQDAMVPQFKMSLFPEITISARVSKSGQPTAQAGDYQSATVEAKTGQKQPLSLTISNLVE